jgi:hypothetical protein
LLALFRFSGCGIAGHAGNGARAYGGVVQIQWARERKTVKLNKATATYLNLLEEMGAKQEMRVAQKQKRLHLQAFSCAQRDWRQTATGALMWACAS